MQLHVFSLHKKGTVTYITKKLRFAKKKKRGGILLGLKINDFGWKRGVLSSQIREKGVFFELGYERGIRFGRRWNY